MAPSWALSFLGRLLSRDTQAALGVHMEEIRSAHKHGVSLRVPLSAIEPQITAALADSLIGTS